MSSLRIHTVINSAIVRAINSLITLAFIVLLAACAGDSGAPNEVVQNESDPSPALAYAGPAPQTTEIQNFKAFFWDPLTGQGSNSDKCSSCHDVGGIGPSSFVRSDNINLAFSVAATGRAGNGNLLVDLATPENSEVVIRVTNGHNCWSADTNFCRTEMIRYIEGWRDGSAAAATVVQLSAPLLQDPSGSKPFPATSAEFASTVWPLVTNTSTANCVSCHSDTAPIQTRQTPYFASADVEIAYEAAKSKIDLATPEDSRLVVRLSDEFHNCWNDCPADAALMQAAIEALANPIVETNIDPDLVTSKALRLFQDGIQAASGGRIENDVIALYEFKLGTGSTVIDRSGVAPSADLTLSGNYEWLSAWGVQFIDGKAQALVDDSQKIHDLITFTGEYSIEAWVAPGNVTQDGPARIVSYSGGNTERNFTLGQTLYNYDFLGRSSLSDANGMPALSTADADEDLQATLQHVVVTYDPIDGRQIYVNGVYTDDIDANTGATLGNWNPGYALVLGSEVNGNDAWAGSIRLLAIHNRALTPASIQNNFDVGVGQKYFLLFSISHLLVNTPDSYIIFEVSQYDNYGYLFSQPYFLSLDPNVVPETFAVEGMRIGINGKIANAGQAYATLQTQVDAGNYDPLNGGQQLSRVGSVIALENGPTLDQFFLTFDRFGANTEVFVDAEPPDPEFVGSGEEIADVAVRNFSEINQSFAQITGIPSTTTSVSNTYNTVIQQLPSSEGMEGFLSSHQMGVTQLAISYCDALVETKSARDALGINLDEVDSGIDDANAKSVANWDADFINPMITAALNTNLSVQPVASDVRELIHHLLFTDADGIAEIDAINNPVPHGLSRCSGGCPDGQTANAAKAACASILGSAGVTLQ